MILDDDLFLQLFDYQFDSNICGMSIKGFWIKVFFYNCLTISLTQTSVE